MKQYIIKCIECGDIFSAGHKKCVRCKACQEKRVTFLRHNPANKVIREYLTRYPSISETRENPRCPECGNKTSKKGMFYVCWSLECTPIGVN